MTDLLPCPFCGGTNVYTEVVAPHTHKIATFMPDYEGGAMVACGDCNAANWRDGANAEAEVIALWNARHAQEDAAQEVVPANMGPWRCDYCGSDYTMNAICCDKRREYLRAHAPAHFTLDQLAGACIEAGVPSNVYESLAMELRDV